MTTATCVTSHLNQHEAFAISIVRRVRLRVAQYKLLQATFSEINRGPKGRIRHKYLAAGGSGLSRDGLEANSPKGGECLEPDVCLRKLRIR